MRTKVLIEGLLLLVIGLVSMVEGFRLTNRMDPKQVYDVMGPGLFILFPSIALMAIGIVHLIVNYKKNGSMEKVAIKREMRIRMISMIVVMAVYFFLIESVGYIVASIFFFMLEFRILEVKWRTTVLLSLVLTAIYYIVFVQYCSIIFPHGIFFK